MRNTLSNALNIWLDLFTECDLNCCFYCKEICHLTTTNLYLILQFTKAVGEQKLYHSAISSCLHLVRYIFTTCRLISRSRGICYWRIPQHRGVLRQLLGLNVALHVVFVLIGLNLCSLLPDLYQGPVSGLDFAWIKQLS